MKYILIHLVNILRIISEFLQKLILSVTLSLDVNKEMGLFHVDSTSLDEKG